MPRISPFDKYAEQYEEWFEKNRWVYEAELRAVAIGIGCENMALNKARGVEIGAGTGRFAWPLGIKIGVEPSKCMGNIARKRGIQVLNAVAEELPFENSAFDLVLMVTTICFVDDVNRALLEAHRVLSDGGILIIGFIDRNSKMGKIYLERQNNNVFYKEANFFSVEEIVEHLNHAGFTDLRFNQTIFGNLAETAQDEPVKNGHRQGSFVVISGRKGWIGPIFLWKKLKKED